MAHEGCKAAARIDNTEHLWGRKMQYQNNQYTLIAEVHCL